VPHHEGQVVLVTGAASGIGRATVARLAASGAAVALVDRDAERLASAVPAGARAISIVADVAREDDVRDAVARAVEELGGLGGLVTAAGIFDPAERRPVAEVEVATFVRTLAVNLTGTFLAVKYALPHLAARGGAIVTIASTAALRAHGFGAGYTASKGGVVALTRLVAAQYAGQGVRANCVCPGLTETGMTEQVLRDPEYRARVSRAIPLGRVARADDIAAVVCHLLGDDATYVTGQVIAADGGTTTL
jgi:NAD(P)-dependent dehydrogenase (short-subunit alcohol dehydrogenase family)